MPVSGRLATRRSTILAGMAGALALLVLGSGTVFAATPAPARAQKAGDVAGFRLPFEPGLGVSVQQAWDTGYSHNGRSTYAYDFGLYEGTPVLAAASGTVSHVREGETACGGRESLLDANYVTVDHPDGSTTMYGHLSTVDVAVGDVVTAGQQVGRSGNTGFTGCRPHLHFARQLQGRPATQSIPIFFDDYPDRALRDGEVVRQTAGCTASRKLAPTGRFCGTYAPVDAGSAPFFSRLDSTIDFDWTKRSPGGYWLDDDSGGFRARWSGRFGFAVDGVYEFRVVTTDHVRVLIDGEVVVDRWSVNRTSRTLSVTLNLAEGDHTIEVEHLDVDGKGVLRLEWDRVLVGGAWARWAVAEPAM